MVMVTREGTQTLPFLSCILRVAYSIVDLPCRHNFLGCFHHPHLCLLAVDSLCGCDLKAALAFTALTFFIVVPLLRQRAQAGVGNARGDREWIILCPKNMKIWNNIRETNRIKREEELEYRKYCEKRAAASTALRINPVKFPLTRLPLWLRSQGRSAKGALSNGEGIRDQKRCRDQRLPPSILS